MGFIDELQAAKHAKPRRMRCSIEVILDGLDDAEAKADAQGEYTWNEQSQEWA